MDDQVRSTAGSPRRASRRLVGGGGRSARSAVRMAGAQYLFKVRGQRLADRDSLGRAVTELDQVIKRQETELQQHPGQVLIGQARRPGHLSQRRQLLGYIPDSQAIG